MKLRTKHFVRLGVICTFFLSVMIGCGSQQSNPIQVPSNSTGNTNLTRILNYSGRVELPNPQLNPSDYKVVVASGTYDISPKGTFTIPMNEGATGLITIIDSNGQPVLLKVFPKHELLREKEPLVNAESTAVAYLYMNPILAQYNKPLTAAVLLENLKQTEATGKLAKLISETFGNRQACVNDEHFAVLLGNGLDSLFAKAGDLSGLEEPINREGQADDSKPWFFDRDNQNKDNISLSAFLYNNQTHKASINYENAGYKWWTVALDPATTGPNYTPIYNYYGYWGNIIGIIPPASFELPTISGIIEQIIANSIGGIISLLSGNEVDFISQLMDVELLNIGPENGSIDFPIPAGALFGQLSFYSMGFTNELSSTVPASPDRCWTPTFLQIFFQFAVPLVSVIYDVSDIADVREISDLFQSPEFRDLALSITPLIASLGAHLYNQQGVEALHDCYDILAAILSDSTGMWFLREIVFKGNIPVSTLSVLIGQFIALDKAIIACESVCVFLLSMIHTFTIPNFDNYVIDLTKYSTDTMPPVWDSTIGITGAAPGDSEVTVQWGSATDASSPPVEYLLYVDQDGIPWDQPPIVRSSSGSYTFSGLDNGQTYWFGVRCQDSATPRNIDSNDIILSAVPNGGINPFNPVDITPSWWLDFNPEDVFIDGDYAYTVGHDDAVNIFDISDPLHPIWVNSVYIPPDYTSEITVTGGYAYVADYSFGLQIIDVDPPENAYVVNSVDTPGYARSVSVSNGYAFVADYAGGLQIVDVSPPTEASIVNCVTFSQPAQDVSVQNGYAYVATSTAGLQIVDISIPESAFILNTVASVSAAYVEAAGDFAYVSNGSSFYIIDITPPGDAAVIKSLSCACSDIYISDGYAYTSGSNGVRIVDIVPPTSAFIVKSISSPSASGIYVNSGYAFVACSDRGLQTIDVEPPLSAFIANTLETPKSATDLYFLDNYVFLAGDSLRLRILDVSTPESAYIVKTIGTSSSLNDIYVSGGYAYATSSNSGLYIFDVEPVNNSFVVGGGVTPNSGSGVFVSSDYAYVTSGQRLYIVNVESPSSAFVENSVSTPGNAYGINVAGGYAFVADGSLGLQIVDIEPLEDAFITKAVDTPGQSYDISVSNGLAYIADGNVGLQIIDVDPIENASIIKTADTQGSASNVFIKDGYAYVADGNYGLQVFDIQPPSSADVVSHIDTPGYAIDVVVDSGYAYVADSSGGMRIIKLW